jgi:CDP-glucose 4,6-dehydratase
VRPWTHVLDIIYGYVLAANNSLKEKNSYDTFNFSSNTKHNYNVLKIANKFLNKFDLNALKMDKRKNFIEKAFLNIDSNKSREILDWHPTYEIEDAINLTVEWYNDIFKKKMQPADKTIQQIQSYLNNLQEFNKLNLRKAI